MAKRKQKSAAAALDELESLGDRIAEWVGANPLLVLGSGLAVLLVAGVIGLVGARGQQASDAFSAQLAAADADYRRAMGTGPNELGITQPANPETARRVRAEYVERFSELARGHEGTPAAALAWLEVGQLQRDLGESAEALATLEAAAHELDRDAVIRAMVLERIAALHEAEGRWAEAAAAYQSASDIADFPLRYSALAQAARCYAVAGDTTQALAAYDRIKTEAPRARVPDHIRALLNELDARQ